MAPCRWGLSSLICIGTALILMILLAGFSPAAEPPKAASLELPLVFKPNRGQINSEYQYVVHEPGLGMGLLPGGFDVAIAGTGGKSKIVNFRFAGRNLRIKLVPERKLPGKANYLRGADKSRWITGVPMYSALRYRSLYQGIDVVFYGNGKNLEHDFVVNPGADTNQIAIEVSGADLRTTASGDLAVEANGGSLLLKKPIAYQTGPRGRMPVKASYRLRESQIRLEVGAYDHARPLVIDPVFVYSTFLAGSLHDRVTGVAVDSGGNAYITGITYSTDFPTASAYSTTCVSCTDPYALSPDLYVAKLDPTGSQLIYSTYIGGSRSETPWAIRVDGNGNAVVAGSTMSPDFPAVNSLSAYQGYTNTYAFILSLSPSGSALNYSSLIGQVSNDSGFQDGSISYGYSAGIGLAIDSQGSAYIAGQTWNSFFPITPGTLAATVPNYPYVSMFVTKLESSGAVAYSTIVPGVSNLPYAYNVNNFLPYAVAVDATGNAFIGGRAGPGLPTSTGALSTLFPGDLNNSSQSVGFVLKLNPSASQIDFATYLPETESVAAIILRDSGASYVAGRTNSPSFPASPGAFQTTMAAGVNCTCNAGYVAELDATGSTLIAATFLAGTPAQTNAGTSILSLSRSTSGSLLVGGITASVDFPLVTPLEKNFPGYANTGFATEVKPDLSAVLFSTFISGLRVTSHTERLHLDTAPGGNIVVVVRRMTMIFRPRWAASSLTFPQQWSTATHMDS